MHNKFLRYILFLGLLIGSIAHLSAQKKRVLVIPFDQFQFESPTTLEEIASFNKWEDPLVIYEEYNNAIISFMNETEEDIEFFTPSESDIANIRRSLPREYVRNPVSHYGVDVTPIIENGFLSQLMENMTADYILFINRYRISGKLIATKVKVASSGKFLNWSAHFIDYEIYNPKGELAAGSERFQFTPHNPNSKTYLTKGTLTSGLERPSLKLATDIHRKLVKYEKRGEAIFKDQVK